MGQLKEFVLLLLCAIGKCTGLIHQLNDTAYAMMPPIYRMEPYDECFFQPGGLYCTVDFSLVTDSPSPLMDMIREYSEVSSKRFNHSKLTYGVCVNTTCKIFNSTDLRLRLESCLNESMFRGYGLKTNVPDKFYCDTGEKKIDVTTTDFVVAGVILLLMLLNIVGSCYDFCANPGKDGVKFLLCFSIRRNWRRLMTPPAVTEPRLKRFKSFNGIKTIGIFLVIFAHSMIITGYFVDNTAFVENEYNKFIYHIILNGTLIVQTFFIISGFLLAYNLQMYAEKHELDWKVIIKAIVMRWLRLTPSYAIVLAFVLTWYRHLGSGPIWQKVVGTEVSECRDTWWYHLLYINNYVDGSECMSHTWYIAADTQLYILGVIVCVACQSSRSRKVVLTLLFLAGVAIPAAITYLRDLDGTMIVSPESTRGFYVHDPTYIEVYIRGHTNGANYIMGLAFGLIVYHAQAVGFDAKNYQKYRFCIWLLLPIGVMVVGSGRVFYLDGPRVSLAVRVATAALLKPVFGLIVAICLASSIFKFENVYRGILEWWGWTTLSRITYSVYLLHYPFVKYFLGSQVTLLHITFLFASLIFNGTICLVFLGAFPFWLLVESPLAQLVKLCLPMGQKETKPPEVEDRRDTNIINYKL